MTNKQGYPVSKYVLKKATIFTLLGVIPIAICGTLLPSTIISILGIYLPITTLILIALADIAHMEIEIREKEHTISNLKSQLSIVQNELEVLKHLSITEQEYKKRHEMFKEIVGKINGSKTPEEVLDKLSEFVLKNFSGIKGFSILIKGKRALSPAPLLRKGDTSPPQIKLEIPGRENMFFVHIGYLPGYMYKHEIEDILELFSIALKKWEDLKGSITDHLTGAYNRQFLELIKEYLEDINSQYTLLMIDLDGFKEVNDTLGHDKGDEVLKNTVKRIERSLRGDDILIRYGGDEFIVIIPGTTMENGLRVAERIRLSIRNNLISASIGAVHKEKGKRADFSRLLKLADALMYLAKREKDKVVGGKWEEKSPH